MIGTARRATAAALGVAAMLMAAFVALTAAHPAAGADVPYDDQSSAGYITFFDAANKPMTSGSIDARPFVRRAVASVAAASPYDGDGRTATLVAYQPRQGVEPADWSGDVLTISTPYADAQHPMAKAEAEDFSLSDYFLNLPPRWDGYIQLRMYYGVPGEPTLTTSYPSTDIKVSGGTWSVVRSGPPVDEANPPAPDPGAAGGGANGDQPGGASSGASSAGGGDGSSSAGNGSDSPSGAGTGASPAGQIAQNADASSTSGGSSAGMTTAIVLAVLAIAVIVFVAVLLVRRRRLED